MQMRLKYFYYDLFFIMEKFSSIWSSRLLTFCHSKMRHFLLLYLEMINRLIIL